jgi:lipopolysaccharide/colanic/teichoic acid biosynthesis glycosyltransferase
MRRRILEGTIAAAGLLIAALPLALAMLAIKLTSRGPMLYRQTRVGRDGRLFLVYKLRTMSVSTGGPEVTAIADARITPVGRFLRKFKIDELPQLWNIIRGEMRLIGPRPEVPRFVQHYSDAEREILRATPGLASVSALVYAGEAEALQNHSDPDAAYIRHIMPLKIAADRAYECTRTVWSDIRLMTELALMIVGRNTREDPQFHIPPTERSTTGAEPPRRDTVAI